MRIVSGLKTLALAGVLGLAAAFAAPQVQAQAKAVEMLPAEPMGEDGLHKESWFQETFLDLKEDATDAAAEGKQLLVIWEQVGCPFCAMTHEVNLRDPRIVKYIRDNFFVVQMNLKGDREVIDFDGASRSEKDQAKFANMRLTPVLQFFPADPAESEGKSGKDATVFSVPGYWSPEHFLNQFVYVRTGAYKTEKSFLAWYRKGEGVLKLDDL